ncbi:MULTISPECIES: sensor domain-containing protein [Rhodanobacter]|uniref:sensor domain-containing protein n=1 Tax=Rhodanobacter TaxID=75309 RepID=UPI0003FBE96D|nr:MULTISPECIES: EAL domain-containing protein [Rhodanobacter]KZC20542.1 diguanylate cyclase [Rhodanobacter denitrificans]UJJ50278.1 EAL domain-containing protein [Rhodanobacter denitrificans]UJM92993.1 EAL domain-containing protein [Rhodanobacter denitrificans]UJM96523.1 EAL domain-containing protein [Rhodanobacter denitrificans]UJN20647.1 EAL domain-containing protein [Rhodanobacter denitrificans]
MDQPRLELDFHQVFERVTDAYVALDRDWRYTYLNATACELFGRRAEELIGRHIWTEFPEGVGQPFHRAYEKAMAEQCPQQIEAFYPPYNRWFENRIYPSADGLTIYFRDITERKRAEQLAAGQHEILEGIAVQRPLVESLERIARLHETMNPGALCSLLLLDEDGRHVLHGAAPSLPEAYSRTLHGLEIGEAHGSCGTAAWRGERVVVADIAGHPYWENYRGPALAHGLKACWSTPVFGSHHEVLGTFAVYFREPREPREEELRSIDRMLPITGIAIESARLVERLHERHRFFEMSQEIFCILDPHTERLVQFNPSLPRITGYGASELTSRSYREFLQPEEPRDSSDPMVVLGRSGEQVHEFVNRCRCRDGSERLLEWVSFAAPDGLVYAVARDITERRRVEAELAHASSHDPVSGLPQHLLLGREVGDVLKDSTEPVWVLVIGLDRFQGVNESVGHLTGDDVLRQLAGRLQAALAGQGRVARFAGDEFVVTATGLSADGALALAECLRAAVAEPLEGGDYRLLLTASIGISHSPDHGTDPNDLLRRAEAAMNQAKREGRDRVSMFSVEQMRDLEDRLVMGNQLRNAIRHDELELHYQPQYRAADRRLTGFEALLRWNSRQLGRVPPARFIPIAEALGLMPEIGEWVLDAACRQLRAWLDRGHGDFTVAVNMSAQQVQRPGLAARVGAALQRHGVPAAMLDIEITESSFMENVWRVQRTLAELKALGIRLSLDDFGTGYSSLAYLKQFPIDKLKIDQAFVRALPAGTADASIVRTIIAVAHELRMHVAAEGVETAAQADFLAAAGCGELQGNHLGPALPVLQAGERFDDGYA